MGLSFIPVVESVDLGTSLPSEMEVGFTGRRKATGPSGLSPTSFKGGDGELTKLMGSTWRREQIPKDSCESAGVSIYREGDGFLL